MKLPTIVLGASLAFFALCIGVLVLTTRNPEDMPPAPEAEEAALPAETIEEEAVAGLREAETAAVPACAIGVPGPASSPLTEEISFSMKEAAVRAVLAREALFLENDPECLRAYEQAVAVNPDDKEKLAERTDKEIRATALMMALIMDLPEADEVRRLMLKDDAVWEYEEGEVHVTVTIEDPPEEVVGHGDDGTLLYGTSNGWGTTVFYRDGRWY